MSLSRQRFWSFTGAGASDTTVAVGATLVFLTFLPVPLFFLSLICGFCPSVAGGLTGPVAPGSEGLKKGCSEVVIETAETGAFGVENILVLESRASKRATFSPLADY